MELVLSGIDKANIAAFTQDSMQPDGIITIDSLYNFKDTYRRVLKAINSQEDTIIFGVIDFQARALEFGLKIPPTTLILSGAPAPGAKAMRNSPTLGLDAFCQKFLVWEDDRGTHLSFNDLLLLAERQGTNKNFALRVIDFRLKNTFAKALRE